MPGLEIDPDQMGKVVSYNYVNVTAKGNPIRPIVYRFRPDLSWDDVVDNYTTPRAIAYGMFIFISALTCAT